MPGVLVRAVETGRRDAERPPFRTVATGRLRRRWGRYGLVERKYTLPPSWRGLDSVLGSILLPPVLQQERGAATA